MSRQKLIKKLKEKNPQLSLEQLERVLNIFAESIEEALLKKIDVEIRHFCSFRIVKLKSSAYLRNPKTNQLIYRPERVKIRFKASKKLNRLINE